MFMYNTGLEKPDTYDRVLHHYVRQELQSFIRDLQSTLIRGIDKVDTKTLKLNKLYNDMSIVQNDLSLVELDIEKYKSLFEYYTKNIYKAKYMKIDNGMYLTTNNQMYSDTLNNVIQIASSGMHLLSTILNAVEEIQKTNTVYGVLVRHSLTGKAINITHPCMTARFINTLLPNNANYVIYIYTSDKDKEYEAYDKNLLESLDIDIDEYKEYMKELLAVNMSFTNIESKEAYQTLETKYDLIDLTNSNIILQNESANIMDDGVFTMYSKVLCDDSAKKYFETRSEESKAFFRPHYVPVHIWSNGALFPYYGGLIFYGKYLFSRNTYDEVFYATDISLCHSNNVNPHKDNTPTKACTGNLKHYTSTTIDCMAYSNAQSPLTNSTMPVGMTEWIKLNVDTAIKLIKELKDAKDSTNG